MEDCSELHEWELVDGCDFTDNIITAMVLKDDYFAIDSGGSSRSAEERDTGGVDSDNPSSDDSDCDSNKFLEASADNVGFVRMELPMRNSGGLGSDETTDLEEIDAVVKDLRGESEAGESSCESVWDNSGGGSEGSGSSDSREVAEVGDGACVAEGEKRVKIWWKVPMVLLKYCFFGMKPVWSLSMAAAMVAILMLLKKLYRMKRKIRSIPLRIAIDDKFCNFSCLVSLDRLDLLIYSCLPFLILHSFFEAYVLGIRLKTWEMCFAYGVVYIS
ncbi:hypothetical protein KSP39_PZI016121 [Platanthera zijinensis]|uniref:Uncharacterized protein n=1 Tax=Platanthera zijinensis TaxID=2320716 RepID=A0AAP0B6R2_9ASPA